jgi:hypothetical protein
VGVWNACGTVQVGHLPAVIVHDLPRDSGGASRAHGRRDGAGD